MQQYYNMAAAQQAQRETVTLPADAYPGKQLTFTAQNGQSVTFSVPAGMGPGSQVPVDVGPPPQQQQHYVDPRQHAALFAMQQQQQYQQQYAAALAAMQQQQQHQQQHAEQVTLPADAYPGKQYTFTAQTGQSVTFSVPAGMGPGSVITLTY
mmetsp:Transcript_15995/g.43149  ORF Transcript_15995/g.43149 Transcript_15995/m.43149 type:complete len:152 (+) Transcript_15995:119-574(+)